jgi:FtsZ-interacting cell division protein ZipA
MDKTTLAAVLVLAVLGFVAWLGGGKKWAFRTLLAALVLVGVAVAGILVYGYWTDKSAEHRAQKIHECAVAKVADPKCEEVPKDSPLKGSFFCPAYSLSDDATPQQEDEALALAEQECRGEMDPKEKSLHEQLVQYKHDHKITGPWTKYQPKGDWFEQNAPGKEKMMLSVKDCAARVRSYYPNAYDDLDDATLTRKLLAKYPTYCNVGLSPPKGYIPEIEGIR